MSTQPISEIVEKQNVDLSPREGSMRYQQIDCFRSKFLYPKFQFVDKSGEPGGRSWKENSFPPIDFAHGPELIFSVPHFRNSGDREFLSRYNLSLC